MATPDPAALIYRANTGRPLTSAEGDANIRLLSQALTVTRAATTLLTFDVPSQYMVIQQNGPLVFNKAATGNLPYAHAQVLVITDGSPISFSDAFYVPDQVYFGDTDVVFDVTSYSADASVRALTLAAYLPKSSSSSMGQYYHFGPTATASQQNITVDNQADFAFTSGAFGFQFWVQLQSLNACFTLGASNGGQRCWDVLVKRATYTPGSNLGSSVGFVVYDASGGLRYIETPNLDALANGEWVHIAGNHDGAGGLSFIINDQEVAPSGGPFASGTFNAVRPGAFSIGYNAGLSGGFAQSNNCNIDGLGFIAGRGFTKAEEGEAHNYGVRRPVSSLSYASQLLAGYELDGDLSDIKGTHNGTATSPQFAA